MEYAFEQAINRFDHFLSREQPARGLVLLDRSSGERRLQELAHEFKTYGHRWGTTHNLSDVPYFADSRASRLIQYADLVSFALWRHFERQDSEFFNVIAGTSILTAASFTDCTTTKQAAEYVAVLDARAGLPSRELGNLVAT